MPPDVVVFPTSTQDVSLVAKACTEMRAPMIPFGTGTGMEGGVISDQVTDNLQFIDNNEFRYYLSLLAYTGT